MIVFVGVVGNTPLFQQDANRYTKWFFFKGIISMKKNLLVTFGLAAIVGFGLHLFAVEQPPENKPVSKPMERPIEFNGVSRQPLERPIENSNERPIEFNYNSRSLNQKPIVDQANERPIEFIGASRGPADKYASLDPAFAKFVDLSLLSDGLGLAKPDLSILTDLALGLAEGERILVRNHRSGLTSDDIIGRAVRFASRSEDKVALERITKAAAVINKPQWAKLVAEIKEFGAASRDEPIVSLEKIDASAIELADTVKAACNNAVLMNSKDELLDLKQVVTESKLEAKLQAFLLGSITKCIESLPIKEVSADLILKEFKGASRGGATLVFSGKNAEYGYRKQSVRQFSMQEAIIDAMAPLRDSLNNLNIAQIERKTGHKIEGDLGASYNSATQILTGSLSGNESREEMERIVMNKNCWLIQIKNVRVKPGTWFSKHDPGHFPEFKRESKCGAVMLYDYDIWAPANTNPTGTGTGTPGRTGTGTPGRTGTGTPGRTGTGTGTGTPGRTNPGPETRVLIANSTQVPLDYFIRINEGGFQRFRLLPGRYYEHSSFANFPKFSISFDVDTGNGLRRVDYLLEPKTKYEFVWSDSGLDLSKQQ